MAPVDTSKLKSIVEDLETQLKVLEHQVSKLTERHISCSHARHLLRDLKQYSLDLSTIRLTIKDKRSECTLSMIEEAEFPDIPCIEITDSSSYFRLVLTEDEPFHYKKYTLQLTPIEAALRPLIEEIELLDGNC